MNLVLLRLLTIKEYYDKYRDYINTSSLEEENKIIINLLDYYYNNNKNNNNIKEINKELLLSLFEDNYYNIKNKELKEDIYNIINNIYNININNNNNKEYNIIIINLLKKYYIEKIINTSINILENIKDKDLDCIDDILQKYKQQKLLLSDEENNIVTSDIDKILDVEKDTSGFEWFCNELSDILGKIKGGDIGIIVANPDTGKTAFILTVITALLKQGARVLHINNEERGTKVKLRAIQNLCDMTKFQILQNKEKAQEMVNKYMKDNYFLYDIVSISVREIRTLIEKHAPDVVIIDQSSKIKVSKQDRNDLTLTEIYKSLRELAKEFNIHIIGVSQADSNAYGKEWLTMDNLFGSKIGVQGEMDYIVGIGKSTDPSKEDWRYLSFPKNKLTGKNSSRLILKIDKERSKYYNV